MRVRHRSKGDSKIAVREIVDVNGLIVRENDRRCRLRFHPNVDGAVRIQEAADLCNSASVIVPLDNGKISTGEYIAIESQAIVGIASFDCIFPIRPGRWWCAVGFKNKPVVAASSRCGGAISHDENIVTIAAVEKVLARPADEQV